MNKYICIHGHFYQPPRENPWSSQVERQASAEPYHDWNERISDECYSRNAAARILDDEHQVIETRNNYAQISFNFGPTLLAWMEQKDPQTHRAILEADKMSQERYSGHGSALAQVYSHLIMPLANSRDKRTQIIWGIRDFEYRFQRAPEGMWLAETAVDLETLDIMAECGIKFTILAPHQAKRVCSLEHKRWHKVSPEALNTSRAYLCELPSGRTISLFFYHGAMAQAVAFNGLLHSGENFAQSLQEGFHQESDTPQLMHIATDGETYGHHHRFGEMALAYCLYWIESHELARLTNYGEYLEKYPPTHAVEILDNSSWSCIHGIERWRSDCGCSTGGQPEWNQQWRAPLRESLDWLRDQLISIYEHELSVYTSNIWAMRDDYIETLLGDESQDISAFFQKYISQTLTEQDRTKILTLLESQRYALLMYTSCGWFFADISGIEPMQILKYAARAIELIKAIKKMDLETTFLQYLAKAKSNLPHNNTGADLYRTFVSSAEKSSVVPTDC